MKNPAEKPTIIRRRKVEDGGIEETRTEKGSEEKKGKVIPFKKPENPQSDVDLKRFEDGAKKQIKKFIEKKEEKEKGENIRKELDDFFEKKSA